MVISLLRYAHIALWVILANLRLPSVGNGMTYFEDFTHAGEPTRPEAGTNCYWRYTNAACSRQSTWRDFVPGDGHAYVTGNSTAAVGDYQTLYFGLVGPGHRIETRIRGAAVQGYTGFLFIWMGPPANEIDIEIVPVDRAGKVPHTSADWTDTRFNTFRDDEDDSTFKPVMDAHGTKVSLFEDDAYHTLTVDWLTNRVDYRIDGVLQHTVESWLIPVLPAEVIVGFRRVAWAGEVAWTGTRTMIVDWLAIHPIDDDGPTAIADDYRVQRGNRLVVPPARGVLANDSGGQSAVVVSPPEHGSLSLRKDGSFAYRPKRGFVGRDQFVYRNTGLTTNEESNAATVWITVDEAAGSSYAQ